MAMVASALAGVMAGVAAGGVQALWTAAQGYIAANAQAIYAWVGIMPSIVPVPDPMVVITANIVPTFTPLNLAGFDQCQNADAALAFLGAAMQLNMLTWQVGFMTLGFTLAPLTLAPPVVTLTKSMATDQMTAMTVLANDIINAVKLGVTTGVPAAAGAHGSFTGAATLTSVI